MRIKKLLGIILTVVLSVNSLAVFADYSNADGIIQWDFAEYTDKITTTVAGFTQDYNGLTIAIANNGDDSISTGGVYWRGGGDPKNGDSPRYISYTPEENGTLYVTGKLNSSGGRWGIHTALNYAFLADNSTQSTSEETVSMECTAGSSYYIYSKARSATVKSIRYVTENAALTAKVELNNMYGDNMLIQRGKPIYFEGYSENATGAVITLTNDSNPKDSQTRSIASLSDSDTWNVTFDAVSNYTDTYTLTIVPETDNPKNQTENTVISNIKFGDLYLCGGQSNMWYYLTYYIGLDYTQQEINSCENSDIRILQLPTPSEDNREVNRSQPQNKLAIDAQWRELDRDFVMNKYLPATVYSLAKKLNKETDVPIGILSTAVGGTTIAQWLENTGIDDFNKKKNWYNSRIYPLHNMELSGIFWYQGCSDKDNGADDYEQKMTALINEYRYLFGNAELPFYYVQLTRNGIIYSDTTSDERQDNTGMRDVRQAQTNTYLNMKNKTNLGFVSTLDIYGEKEYIAGKS